MMWEVYKSFVEDDLAIPVVAGRKTESEKFAGAQDTYTIEALMHDGQARAVRDEPFLRKCISGCVQYQICRQE